METKVHTFLKSGLLDKYILGTASPSEISEVESYLNTYPEVQKEYEKLQKNLEIIAKANAVEAPKFILNNILSQIDEEADSTVIKMSTHASKRTHTPWYYIAASIAAIFFGISTFLLYQQNQALKQENQVVVDEIFDLRSDIERNNRKMDHVMRQFMKLNNPDTEKYVLRGNERAKNLETVAYINAKDKTSMIDVVSLPKLPENQTYQIWAELQDRMVNLGILDESDRNLKPIPYMEDALGLSITIEPKDSMNEATADNEVAEISLKSNK